MAEMGDGRAKAQVYRVRRQGVDSRTARVKERLGGQHRKGVLAWTAAGKSAGTEKGAYLTSLHLT